LLIAIEIVVMELMKDNELSNFYKKTSILVTGGNGVRKTVKVVKVGKTKS
jgi:hypothetical protein